MTIEKKKQIQWRKLHATFSKKRMKSISAVEYFVNGNIIRTSEKLQVEEAIMKENAICFSLAYSSPVFNKEIIKLVG